MKNVHGTMTENPLGILPIKNMIWKFAIPGIISQMVTSMHNIVDQVFIGWGIGDLGIAATNICFPLATITTALSVLFGLGAVARFSILLGKKQPDEARKVLGNALTLMLIFGAVIAACGVLFLEPMLYLFGATDAIMPFAKPYACIISLGVPFGILSTGLSYFIRADGNPNYSSIVLLSGAVFNMIFDPVFLFVFHMGMEGIALATVLGQVLSAILAIHYLLKRFQSVQLALSDMRLNFPIIKTIFALGAATFSTHVLATAANIIQMNALKTYGALSIYGSEITIAATGAIAKISMCLMSCVIGISLGCQPIYGFNFGSKKYDRVKETYLLAIKYGTIVSITAFLILQLFPKIVLSMFGSTDPLFYEFGTMYIRIYMAVLFLNALQPITSTFFTAIGRAKISLWITIVRQGLLMIPLLLVLPTLFGITGVCLAGPVSDTIAAVIVIVCAYRQVLRLNAMEEKEE